MKREDLHRAYYLESDIGSCKTIISQLEHDEKYVCMCYEAGCGYCANSPLPNQKEIKRFRGRTFSTIKPLILLQ